VTAVYVGAVVGFIFWVYVGWWMRAVLRELRAGRAALERLSPPPTQFAVTEPEGDASQRNLERIERGFS
jgi:hypothetical protein